MGGAVYRILDIGFDFYRCTVKQNEIKGCKRDRSVAADSFSYWKFIVAEDVCTARRVRTGCKNQISVCVCVCRNEMHRKISKSINEITVCNTDRPAAHILMLRCTRNQLGVLQRFGSDARAKKCRFWGASGWHHRQVVAVDSSAAAFLTLLIVTDFPNADSQPSTNNGPADEAEGIVSISRLIGPGPWRGENAFRQRAGWQFHFNCSSWCECIDWRHWIFAPLHDHDYAANGTGEGGDFFVLKQTRFRQRSLQGFFSVSI